MKKILLCIVLLNTGCAGMYNYVHERCDAMGYTSQYAHARCFYALREVERAKFNQSLKNLGHSMDPPVILYAPLY